MSSSVFVTGGSGYIGQHVAIAFRNAGFRVYGLVRSADKGTSLIRHEIIPVVGDVHKPETFEEVLKRSTIIVDTVADFGHPTDPLNGNKALLSAVSKLSSSSAPKTLIYTSGVLVYPHSEEVRDESLSPVGDYPFLAARLAFEQQVTSTKELRGIVIRPGFVYGGASGAGNHLVNMFEEAKKDKIVINKSVRTKRWNWIHVVDLASAFVQAAQRSHQVRGEVFNIVAPYTPTYEEIVRATAKVAGFKGTIEITDAPGKDFISTIGARTCLLNNKKALNLLDWSPNHLGPLDELDVYYATIKGSY